MNKNGFTLVELIAVMVILSLLIVICLTTFTNISRSLKKSMSEDLLNKIKVSAENYATDTNRKTFFVQDLIYAGYLAGDEDDNVYSPLSKNVRMNCYPIEVRFVKGSFEATITQEEFLQGSNCDTQRLLTLDANFGISIDDINGYNYGLVINCVSGEEIIVVSNQGYYDKRVCPTSGSYHLTTIVTESCTFTASWRKKIDNEIISHTLTI